MAAAVAEVIWMVGLLKDLCVNVLTPIQLYSDYNAAMQINVNPEFHERTKHIDIDCHFVTEKLKEGLIHPVHVSTKFKLADLLTKRFGVAQHSFLLSKLGVLDIFHPPARGGVLKLAKVS